MKGLVCKVCGYIALDGNKDVCPVCHAKNSFDEKDDAYKMPDFKAEKGESEKKHIPFLTLTQNCGLIPDSGCVDISAKIGEILHPAMPEHHITDITFYVDNKFVARTELTSDISPAAVAHLKTGTKGKVQVIENCNVHGKWYNEITV